MTAVCHSANSCQNNGSVYGKYGKEWLWPDIYGKYGKEWLWPDIYGNYGILVINLKSDFYDLEKYLICIFFSLIWDTGDDENDVCLSWSFIAQSTLLRSC